MGETPHGPSDRAKLGLITQEIIHDLRLDREMRQLKEGIDAWIQECSPEIQDKLRWQFQGGSKYFRPLTVFCCHRAARDTDIPARTIRNAIVLEMFHNVSLIIDDIVDESDERRGKETLHKRFERLPALMVAGYIVADGYEMLSNDPEHDSDARAREDSMRYDIGQFSELLKRLGVAECAQWRLRRQPLGVEDWRRIAREDTGAMFEVCACLGARSDRLRVFGRLLGMLYHGCDDVGDVSELTALGEGGYEDLKDGILTLPAALAIQGDERIRELFVRPGERSENQLKDLRRAFRTQLGAAEEELDRIAGDAKQEAELSCPERVDALNRLVDHTRQLSRR